MLRFFFPRSLTGNGSQQTGPVAVQVVFSLYIITYKVWSLCGIVWSIIPQVYIFNRFVVYRRPSHRIPISILILSGLSLPWGPLQHYRAERIG